MKWKKRNKHLTDVLMLAVIFILAVFVFNRGTNKENRNMTADIGSAARPQVTFSYNGYALNPLPVYTKKMDITAVRDTVTPVTADRIEMNLKAYENVIESLTYSVYTLDGEEKLFENTLKSPGESVLLTFEGEQLLEKERVLQIVLNQEEEKKSYLYTRIMDAADKNVLECLDYTRSFHENALNKVADVGVGAALEPNEESDNTTFGHVNIHSDYDHVTWGNLMPQVEGGERWNIKEINSTCTSIQLQYRVRCKGEENETDLYNVTEFFRVRHVSEGGTDYLLDYDRTMEQIFDASHQMINESGIILGITDSNVQYMASKGNKITAFVQADELWSYNRDSNEISLVFSFADAENTDTRNLFPQHEIRLLAMDDNGNAVFVVYGYMNRGRYEGETGVLVYYYNAEDNTVEEKVFLSGNRSYGRIIKELGELVYYSTEQNMLYVMADGTLYEIDVDKGQETELITGLADDQYVVSSDGHIAAYQEKTGEDGGQRVIIKNFKTGKERNVECGEGERIKPLGFIKNDFVYGVSKTIDIGKTVSGQEVVPMYKVEIQNSKGESVKTYQQANTYILGADSQNNMVTLSRAVKEGTTYTAVAEDYITSNEQSDEISVYAEVYVTELKETQVRLAYNDYEEIAGTQPKLLEPKQIIRKSGNVIEFNSEGISGKCYVYAYGELQGIYDNAGEAVRAADMYNGTAVSAKQEYIWERGNRDLEYVIPGDSSSLAAIHERLRNGGSPMEIMNELSDGNGLDLTGCSIEELLYIINQGSPVIAMTDAVNAVVLTGYAEGYVVYERAGGGERGNASYEQMIEMTNGSGNTFVAALFGKR